MSLICVETLHQPLLKVLDPEAKIQPFSESHLEVDYDLQMSCFVADFKCNEYSGRLCLDRWVIRLSGLHRRRKLTLRGGHLIGKANFAHD